MFGPVSGGHFNPLVSFADAACGGLRWRDAAAYLPAQVAGCAGGAVITMGCGDACPFYPGKRYLDCDLPDPAGLDVDAVRPIRDDIHQRVRHLLSELDATG